MALYPKFSGISHTESFLFHRRLYLYAPTGQRRKQHASICSAKELLHSINRKSYPAYKSLRGAYQFDRYILSIDHVQGDPFASPSHISVKLSHRDTGFPAEYYKVPLTRITLGDFLNRQFEQQVNRYTFRAKAPEKRPDLSKPLWSGGSCTYRL